MRIELAKHDLANWIRCGRLQRSTSHWEKVFDRKAMQRSIGNLSGHMKICQKEEIIKRQVDIFAK